MSHYHHFAQRAKERFGLDVSEARYAAWCQNIVDCAPNVRLLDIDGLAGRSNWKCTFAGHVMRCVFENHLEELITCCPYGAALHQARLEPHRQDGVAKLRRLRQK